jgi:hypothetical protein
VKARAAVLVITVAAAVAGLGRLTWSLRAGRAAAAARYEEERDRQRRALGGTRKAATPTADPTRRPICVRGLDTFVVAAQRALGALPVGDRRARLEALRVAGDLAVRAEKAAEVAHPPPALPRRMGAVGEGGALVAYLPPRTACGGAGFAEILDDRPGASPGAAAGAGAGAAALKAASSTAKPEKPKPDKPKPKRKKGR